MQVVDVHSASHSFLVAMFLLNDSCDVIRFFSHCKMFGLEQ